LQRGTLINRLADKMNHQPTIVTGAIADTEIIAGILQGQKDLYAIIVRRYNQRLYRIGMSVINDDAEVEDVMQVTYIKAYENLAKFEGKSSFSTWLTRILINESLLRLKKRKNSILLNDDTMNNEIYQQYSIDAQTPVSATLNSELKTILEKSIRQLPEKYRAVFVMRELINMNVAETKECLEISEANVKVRLNRARALLRNSLDKYYENEDILHFHLTRCDRMVNLVMSKLESF
jgi:RNA polymerase sigma factor (sigma-70 family)